MKLKAILILGIIVLSLIPVYMIYKYLQQVMKPKESMRNFLFYLCAVLALIFTYTFLLVFIIKMLFPAA
ncbi:MAG: hypothetical protein JNK27_01610 [Chitinophagaceae bacterium]|nr:hypothetical protein [Chitinophagaceae bacterium]